MKKQKVCTICNSNKYHAKGLCRKCYMLEWIKNNPKYNRAYKKKNYEKYADKKREYQKIYNKTEEGLNSMRNCRHKRRAVKHITDITREWLIELKKIKTCEICGCVMDNNGTKINGKQLDHIIPINVGGLHMKNNVRFICKKCNSERPKDGRDLI